MNKYFLFGLVGCGWVMGCTSPTNTPSDTSSSSHLPPSSVIATIGSYRLSKQEFLRRYQEFGKGQTPPQFLQRLIDEKLLLLDAKRRKLERAPRVAERVRKGVAQSALQQGFETWFQPKSVTTLEVRKYYQDDIALFVKPSRVGAWHCLALFPASFRLTANKRTERGRYLLELSSSLRAQRAAKKKAIQQQTLAIANTVLAAIKKENPRDAKTFAAIVKPYLTVYNRPDPQLLHWGQGFQVAISSNAKASGSRLATVLQEQRAKLANMFYCDMCRALEDVLDQHVKRWQPTQGFILTKELQTFLGIISDATRRPVERLRVRDLGLFAKENMVAPFANAAFALENNAFTQELVATQFGYHIIFRTSYIPGKTISFAEVEERLRKNIFLHKRPIMFRRWLDALRKRYPILKFPERLKRLRERNL